MNDYDKTILGKIISYCEEISKTHEYYDWIKMGKQQWRGMTKNMREN